MIYVIALILILGSVAAFLYYKRDRIRTLARASRHQDQVEEAGAGGAASGGAGPSNDSVRTIVAKSPNGDIRGRNFIWHLGISQHP